MTPFTLAVRLSAACLLCAALAAALLVAPVGNAVWRGAGAAALAVAAAVAAYRAHGIVHAHLAQRDRELQELSRQLHERDTLYELAQTLGSSLGVSDAMTRLSARLGALVPLSSCALFLCVDDAGTMRCRFASGVDADRILQLTMSEGRWTTNWAGSPRPPARQEDPAASLDAVGDHDVRTVLTSALMCPLIFNNRFVGMLAVYHTDPAIYTDDHERLLTHVAEQASAVVHHSLIFERTQEDALRDPLTGLLNARYVIMHVARELARAERLRAPLALLLLDLDRFKDINDQWGHQVGDRALFTVGTALHSVVRRYDACARYAGDEFIVVLSGCVRDEAEHKRVELQRVISEMPFTAGPGQPLHLSISVGVAMYPVDGSSFEELLAAADARMYQDKAKRRSSAGT